jgi:hypothetical protein
MPAANPRFIIQQRFPHLTLVHHVGLDGCLWATAGRRLLRLEPGGRLVPLGAFPFVAHRDLLGFLRPVARALRADKCNLYVNAHAQVLAIRSAQVYALRPSGLQPLFTIQGDSVLHGGLCEDPAGQVYFGEYFMNPARGPVRIFRLAPDLATWDIAYTFPPGVIRHVHGVYRDPYDPQALWVTGGDFAGECYIYRTRDAFHTLERFGDGGQAWRAVRLFFSPDFISWITDSQLEPNHACRLPRTYLDQPAATVQLSLQRGQAVDASVWYGTHTTDGWYVAFSTIEPGPAIQTDRSRLLVSRDGFHWQTAASFKKDFWRPMKVFKYGVITCPSGALSSQALYLSGEGLVGLDGISLRGALEVSP